MSEQLDDLGNLFRQRFDGFQKDPPEEVWQDIRSRIGGEGKKRRWGLIVFLSSVSLLMLMSGAYFGLRSDTLSDKMLLSMKAQSPAQPALSSHDETDAIVPVLHHSPNNAYVNNQTPISGNKNSKVEQTSAGHKASADADHLTAVNYTGEPVMDADPVNSVDAFQYDRRPDVGITVLESPVNLSTQETVNPDVISQDVPTSDVPTSDSVQKTSTEPVLTSTPPVTADTALASEHDYGKACNMFAGIKFSPGMIYAEEDGTDLISLLAEVNLGYRYKGLSIQSGFGMEWQQFRNDYIVDYATWEPTGKYNYVTWYEVDTIPLIQNDSIIGYIFRPSFHTAQVEIFDSVEHTEAISNPASYTFIHIPLMIGYYRVSGDWGYGIKAGGSYSLLLSKKEDEVHLSAEDARLLGITRLSPDRKKQWFNALLSVEADYYFNDDLSLGLEPWMRYSFGNTTVYDPNHALKPFSWGISAGIKYHF